MQRGKLAVIGREVWNSLSYWSIISTCHQAGQSSRKIVFLAALGLEDGTFKIILL